MLQRDLIPDDVKPRLLGHWGTTPGLNFIYAHLNRIIRQRDVNAIFLAGPGHGGPAAVASAYLDGTYSEVYPRITQDAEGLRKLFRQFSFPGGIPSHVAPETPGSIHEGGELGYVLSHAYGAAFDNPDLVVAAVVGDGEFETGPLAASWHANKFIDPLHDGAVLPILHLNGWKIANPTIPARIHRAELEALLTGYGHEVFTVEGDDPLVLHQAMAATMDVVLERIRDIQAGVAGTRRDRAAAVADDPDGHPQGLDRPEDDRRIAVRGDVAIPSGAVDRHQGQRRPPPDAAGMDGLVPTGGTLRRQRHDRSPGSAPSPRPATGG